MSGHDGFTLFELLVVLAIMGCVAAAVPWAQHSLVERVKLTFATRAATNRIYKGEAQALTTGRPVLLTAVDFVSGIGPRVSVTSDGAVGSTNSLWLFPDGTASPTIIRLESGKLYRCLLVNRLTGVVVDAQ